MSRNGFTPDQKTRVLERDNYQCGLCRERATEVNHRASRGMGGFKAANVLSNACAICWSCNGLIESDPLKAAVALFLGVKISKFSVPTKVEYTHPVYGRVLLDDEGGFAAV